MPTRSPRGMYAAAALVGLLTFAYRLLSLRNLPNDHYMHLQWASELLAGHLPGVDFIDPGMPLAYAASAVAQLVSPTPFADVVLWTALLAVAAVATVVVSARVTSSTLVGLVAGLLTLVFEPRLYSVPKVLVPAVGLWLVHRYAVTPGARGVAHLAVWVTVAGLLRHDLGAVMALGVTVAMVVVHYGQWRDLGMAGARWAMWLGLTVLPYAAYVQFTEGIAEHVRLGTEQAVVDARQLLWGFPEFPIATANPPLWTRGDSAAALFSAARLLPLVSFGVLLWRRRTTERPAMATLAAAIVMLAAYDRFILRHPIDARVPDAVALVAPLLAWACVVPGRSGVGRVVGRTAGGVAFLAVFVGAGHMTNALERLNDSQLLRGHERIVRRLLAAHDDGSRWPWKNFWPSGELPPVIEYVDACTAPSDHVLVTWFGPEYQYFMRRPIAGGLSLFYPGLAYLRTTDQERLIARLRRARVPLMLVNEGHGRIAGYPLVAAYLRDRYRTVGQFTAYDGSAVSIAVDTTLKATRSYGPEAWPCGFDATGGVP